jgi:AraC family transcriptional regulator
MRREGGITAAANEFAKNRDLGAVSPTTIQQIKRKNLVVTRMNCNAATDNRDSPNYHEDSYKIAFRLSDLTQSKLWVDGKLQPDEKRPKGSVAFFDLTMTNAISSTEPLEFVQFYVPRRALSGEQDDRPLVTARDLLVTSGKTLDDPTIAGLAQCLLPALERQNEVNELFLDHVALALLAHLSFKYGAPLSQPKANLGNLAPWQLRRAQELIAAHLDGHLQVAVVAAECGLSTGYFERAFAKSTGQPPHRWLRDRRLERSKELLLGSGLSIAEIALECGFADQAHLTRLFGTAVGMSPGRWRRMNRC